MLLSGHYGTYRVRSCFLIFLNRTTAGGTQHMESGFDTVKDILDVVIVPVVIFALGAMLPHIIELGKRRRFLALIRREMMEMKP